MLIKTLLRQENMKTIERHVAGNMCNIILYNVKYAEDWSKTLCICWVSSPSGFLLVNAGQVLPVGFCNNDAYEL